MKPLFVCLLAAILALAACTSPTATSLPSPSSPVATVQPITPANPLLSADTLIILKRSGGFAGTEEEWKIYPNGRIAASNGKGAQVSPEKVADLLAQIDSLGFFELSESYLPRNTCCDRFTYVLTVQSNSRTHTVTALEAEPSTPRAFWEAIQAVEQLIAGPPQ